MDLDPEHEAGRALEDSAHPPSTWLFLPVAASVIENY